MPFLQMQKLKDIWTKMVNSLWLLPSVLVSTFVALSFFLLYLDGKYSLTIGGTIIGFFGGSADAARNLLSTIASSLITVVSMAFSITIVAIQQAATQYSARILRNFTRDKGNQIVLGMYISTFMYSLLILRTIRSSSNGGDHYVPSLSITFALFMALVCSGLLIYFINHIASSLQSVNVIRNIHEDLVENIDTLFPEMIGESVSIELDVTQLLAESGESEGTRIVKSRENGFLRRIDSGRLEKFSPEEVKAVLILPAVGDFISLGQPVFRIIGKGANRELDLDRLFSALIIGYPRSMDQDPLFLIRMLVDVALKALSPAVNAPTTAEYCLYHLGDALCRLAERKFPSARRRLGNNPIVFFFNMTTWETFVYEAFSQIRLVAQDSVHVTATLLDQLRRICACIPEGDRSEPLEQMVEAVRECLDRQSFDRSAVKMLREKIDNTSKALKSRRR